MHQLGSKFEKNLLRLKFETVAHTKFTDSRWSEMKPLIVLLEKNILLTWDASSPKSPKGKASSSCKVSFKKNSGRGRGKSAKGMSHEGPHSAPVISLSNSSLITYSPIKEKKGTWKRRLYIWYYKKNVAEWIKKWKSLYIWLSTLTSWTLEKCLHVYVFSIFN